MASKRVLIVDDEENIGRSLRMILEREGYAVNVCRTVAEFKKHPDAHRADAYLLDMKLPDGNGIPKSTIQEARESAEREHILRALEESAWNVSRAARTLGMERTNLHKRIRALGLTRGKYWRRDLGPSSLAIFANLRFGMIPVGRFIIVQHHLNAQADRLPALAHSPI